MIECFWCRWPLWPSESPWPTPFSLSVYSVASLRCSRYPRPSCVWWVFLPVQPSAYAYSHWLFPNPSARPIYRINRVWCNRSRCQVRTITFHRWLCERRTNRELESLARTHRRCLKFTYRSVLDCRVFRSWRNMLIWRRCGNSWRSAPETIFYTSMTATSTPFVRCIWRPWDLGHLFDQQSGMNQWGVRVHVMALELRFYHWQLVGGQHVQHDMRILEFFIDDCLVDRHATICTV